MQSLFSHLPENLQSRVLLEEGTLYTSEELKGDPALISFVGLAQRYGVMNVEWLDARAFDLRSNGQSSSEPKNETEMRLYATRLFQTAFNESASDIHILDLGAYGLIQFRRLGLIKDHSQLRGGFVQDLITAIYQTMTLSADTQFSPTLRQDARIAERRFLPPTVHSIRVHTEPLQCQQAKDGCGVFMGLRLLYDRTKAEGSLEDRVAVLGYDKQDGKRFRFLTKRTGLTIISGPTGHGKSTLLKHVMEGQTYSHPEKSYFSIEDPTEYPMNNVKQVMVGSSRITTDTNQRGQAYMDAIAGAMRSDPDVIMIGEIRYPEAAAAAIDAALTGHSVWATLHANNAFGIIRRMVSLLNAANYAEPLEYLCDHNVMAGLVYQRLLPVLCPQCKVPLDSFIKQYPKGSEERERILPDAVFGRLMSVVNNTDQIFVQGAGCDHCHNLRITGQTVAAEVIVADQIMLTHLRDGKYEKAQRYWKEEQGGRSYIEHAIELIAVGLLDPYLAETRLGVPLNFSKAFEEFKGEGK